MTTLAIIVFIIGYLAIIFEHPLRINKTAFSLFTGVLIWAIIAFVPELPSHAGHANLNASQSVSAALASIAEIIFFLLGAMTIVELVDSHQGFRIITDRIRTTKTTQLLWMVGFITFFLSSVLDNLTTAIVMVSLLRKLIKDPDTRKLFAGVVIIASNAGGAFSPIGDVTTTMLWIGGQVSAGAIIQNVFLPSLVCLIIPLVGVQWLLRKTKNIEPSTHQYEQGIVKGSVLMLCLGLGALLFVPVFKTITHLPPYLGMLFGLSVIWIASELLHAKADEAERSKYSVSHALSKVDTSSVLFFLGILLAISGLERLHLLSQLSHALDAWIGNHSAISILIGLASAVIDNVPLVAAAQEMYHFEMDHLFWEFTAYTAGTGGSILIIGSAAGVAVMGMEKIDFIWYLKRISLLALMGYLAGAGTYILVHSLF